MKYFRMFVNHFLNKLIELERYMDKVIEKEIDINFLQSFRDYNSLIFIDMHRMFNPNLFKFIDLHSCMEITTYKI